MSCCRIEVCGALPRSLGLSKTELRAAAAFFAGRSSRRSGLAFRNVAVVLQDDEASAEAHEAINGAKGATDVVTQAYDAIPPEPPGLFGEVFVNADQALRVAPKRKGGSAETIKARYLTYDTLYKGQKLGEDMLPFLVKI